MEGLGKFVAISAATTNADGRLVYKFKKDIIRVGEFADNGYGSPVTVTALHLSHWAKTFAEMKANGVKVPIPINHKDWERSENNRGWVHGMFVEGDRLVMTCELFGDDVEALAAANDVSVFAPKEWTDCDSNHYVIPIRHVALTPVPMVTGLSEFIRIAAALAGSQDTKENVMDLQKIRAAMSIEEELTAENVVELVCSSAMETVAELADLTKKFDAQALELSKKSEPKDAELTKPLDPLVLELVGKDRRRELEGLVASAKITPAVKDKLEAAFVTNTAIEASVSAKRTAEFDSLIDALKANDPVKLGEQSGAQTTAVLKCAMKEQANADEEGSPEKDAERRAAAAKNN